MLTLLASFAQEESRSISENSKWGIRKRFQPGEIGVANKHILGYRYDEGQRKYAIIPGEAESVRWRFQMYIDGVSLREIAENMNNAGIRTTLGNDFQEASVGVILLYVFNLIFSPMSMYYQIKMDVGGKADSYSEAQNQLQAVLRVWLVQIAQDKSPHARRKKEEMRTLPTDDNAAYEDLDKKIA